MTILIVTNKIDPHSDLVIKELRKRKAKYFRLNTEHMHTDYDVSVEVNNEKNSYDISNRINGKKVDSSIVSKIWWRRPEQLSLSNLNGIPKHLHEFVRREYTALIRSIAAVSEEQGIGFVNLPTAMLNANNKAKQQLIAKKVGFEIGDSLFTNNSGQIQRVLPQSKIVKPIDGSAPIVLDDGSEMSIFTNVVSVTEPLLSSNKKECFEATYLQELLEPVCEYRVTVFDNNVFAYTVDMNQSTKVDWRRRPFGEISFSKIADFPLGEQCKAFNRYLNLNYSAFDFIEDESGIKFLECNPNGQFLFLDPLDKTGLLSAFCSFLMRTS